MHMELNSIFSLSPNVFDNYNYKLIFFEELGLNLHPKNLSKLLKLLKPKQKVFLKRKTQPSLIITIL